MDGIATEAFVEGADLPEPEALRGDPTLGASGRALIDALLAGDPGRADDLLARDPALARLTVAGLSLAEVAVATGNAESLRVVLSRGAAFDAVGDGAPLILALHARAPDLALALLDGGTSPTPAGAVLEPLRAAIALGSAGGVRLLLDYGADPNVTGPLGRRPLHLALDMEQFAIAELLIERGADPWALDASGANLATAAATPMLTASPADAAAQVRLRARVRALGWPEPFPAPHELVARAALGDWPPSRG
jgi:uncharacterized protein